MHSKPFNTLGLKKPKTLYSPQDLIFENPERDALKSYSIRALVDYKKRPFIEITNELSKVCVFFDLKSSKAFLDWYLQFYRWFKSELEKNNNLSYTNKKNKPYRKGKGYGRKRYFKKSKNSIFAKRTNTSRSG